MDGSYSFCLPATLIRTDQDCACPSPIPSKMFTKEARVDQDCACPSPFSEPEAGLAAHSSRPKRTLTAWLHLTEACNLDCAYCYALPTGRQMSAEIGQAAVRGLFNSAQQHGFDGLKIKYAGGEPSLRFDLALDLHNLAQRLARETTLELDAVMLSNGVALTRAMLTEMQARGIRLSLSLDGLGANHDLQRPDRSGRGSFRRLQNTLDEIAKLAGPDGLQTSITITLTKLNLAGLPQTIRFLLARGLPFSLNFYRLSERAEHPNLTPDPDELIQALRGAYAELESLPGAGQALLPGLADRVRPDFAHSRPCGVGETYVAIDPLGRPARCHMDLAHPAAQLPVEDPLAAVRAQPGGVQNPSVEDKPDCRACEWRYLCAGGCPLLTYRTTGSYGGRSPYCEVYRAVLPELQSYLPFRA